MKSLRSCSASLLGGNLVDGLPPVVHSVAISLSYSASDCVRQNLIVRMCASVLKYLWNLMISMWYVWSIYTLFVRKYKRLPSVQTILLVSLKRPFYAKTRPLKIKVSGCIVKAKGGPHPLGRQGGGEHRINFDHKISGPSMHCTLL